RSDAPGAPGPPARVALWVEAPGVVERLELAGTADAGRGSLSIALDVDGVGVTLDALRPYLAQAGIEPTLTDGRFTAQLDVAATRTADGLVAGAGGLRSAQLTDAGRPLLVVSDLQADGARVQLGGAAPPSY